MIEEIEGEWRNEAQGMFYEIDDEGGISRYQMNNQERGEGHWTWCQSSHPKEVSNCSRDFSSGYWLEVEGYGKGLEQDLVFGTNDRGIFMYEYNPDHGPAAEDYYYR